MTAKVQNETPLEVSDLLPFHMDMGIENEEEFLYLGKSYATLLIQYWRSRANLNKRHVGKIAKTSPDAQMTAVLNAETREFERKVKFLQVLQKRAEEKPALPTCRPSNWFKPEDIIAVYDGNMFLCGQVVQGPRSLGGIVYVWTDDYSAIDKVFGLPDPRIMQSWELDYLSRPENRAYALLWVTDGDTGAIPGYKEFMKALEREHEAQATER